MVFQEKEQLWRTHVAELTSSQEKTLQDRLARLRRFRVRMTGKHIQISLPTVDVKIMHLLLFDVVAVLKFTLTIRDSTPQSDSLSSRKASRVSLLQQHRKAFFFSFFFFYKGHGVYETLSGHGRSHQVTEQLQFRVIDQVLDKETSE